MLGFNVARVMDAYSKSCDNLILQCANILLHCSDLLSMEADDVVFSGQMWAMSSNFFIDVPYKLLLSCTEHPHLTVDRLIIYPLIILIQFYAICLGILIFY